MKEVKIKGLIERFADLPGKRVVGRTAHDLLDIVVIALCAVMFGVCRCLCCTGREGGRRAYYILLVWISIYFINCSRSRIPG
jgi:hypothetical protein